MEKMKKNRMTMFEDLKREAPTKLGPNSDDPIFAVYITSRTDYSASKS